MCFFFPQIVSDATFDEFSDFLYYSSRFICLVRFSKGIPFVTFDKFTHSLKTHNILATIKLGKKKYFPSKILVISA